MPIPSPVPKAAPATLPEGGLFAAILSYLIPGLGQVYQGRVAKGLLFFVCIYGLFFYGMWLGQWRNVYLPDLARQSNPWSLPAPLANVYNRPHFAGQFWVGIAAWPAIWQYMRYNPAQDAQPPLSGFMRTPPEEELQKLQNHGDKTWDLAWVYTVIAGMLNLMVIYDAYAGPAFALRTGPRRAAGRDFPAPVGARP